MDKGGTLKVPIKNPTVLKTNSVRASMKIGQDRGRSGTPRHHSSRRCVPYRLRSFVIYCWQNTLRPRIAVLLTMDGNRGGMGGGGVSNPRGHFGPFELAQVR